MAGCRCGKPRKATLRINKTRQTLFPEDHQDRPGKNHHADEEQDDRHSRIIFFHPVSLEPLTKTTNIETFHPLGDQAITQQRGKQPREVAPGQWH